MEYRTNFCNGCPDCRDCGRNKMVTMFRCDRCGYESTDRDDFESTMYGKLFCRECYDEYAENGYKN